MKFVRLLNDKGTTYDSYVDYFSLIRLSGFETIEQNEVNGDIDDCLIFPMNNGAAQAMASAKPRKYKAILWQLERPAGPFSELVPSLWDEVWVSDRWLASQLKPLHPNVKFVPIGGHAGLGGEPAAVKLYDLAPMAYLWGKREAKVNQLRGSYRIAPNGWGKERDEILAATRMGLCLHQDRLNILEPLRATLFACWKLPLVYDTCVDYFPYRVYGLDEIDKARDWETNYRMLTETMTFRKCVEEACQ
jgi:hypothetical protein